MLQSKLPSNSQWVIVTVKQPVMWHQTDDETWLFNPGRRYIINAARIPAIHPFIESVSEMDGAALLNRLRAGVNITGARILVERYRERGIGDLLFITGPLSYMYHVSGANLKVHLYAMSDRGMILRGAPFLENGTVLCGPVEYDNLRNYNYHWLIGSVTECDEESDQLNVYDALYRQLGFEPGMIDARWKRPYAYLFDEDYQHLDRLYNWVWETRRVDLRRVGYYVVAPFSNASLRCMNYSKWLEIIRTLASRRPVAIVGYTHLKLPDMDMSAGSFIEKAASLNQLVVPLLDATPLRTLLALIQRASCVFCMDSAPLYLAQAVNTPAVSFWGSHDPGVRIGYSPEYMEAAVWDDTACDQAPCYAYSMWPVHKCPKGDQQAVCECYTTVTVDAVLSKLDKIEKGRAAKP